MIIVRPLDSDVTSLPTDQDVPCSIPVSAVENHSTICMVWVFLCFIILIHVMSCVVLEEAHCTLLTTDQGKPSIVSVILFMVPRNSNRNSGGWSLYIGVSDKCPEWRY